ncbi:hypothetical protein H8N03_20685 [Ramlibacter sp. USB13]|uniref:Uncharacterized protein n=1 Tax=Ramlibacter cellulosilyticus TaxID=2764187 RepID=A0A923MUQ8_9BURK|nr:hypothetical protein [Ramlibacter cellulosilyticus]MBC5785376.1 hypothetical protein [Ramlibacter cellulosilyticus]
MVDRKKQEHPSAPERLRLAAMGMEAECSLVLDGEPTRPEALFGSPRDFIRGELMHREGTSYHLPTGGAVYFDTGVIEVATPVIEIERGCAARAGRSLWEALQIIRRELDAWDARNHHETRLVGFSAHYNVSFELPAGEPANGRSIEQLARLLTYILPAPVMLLATNRRSTGVGVRPRKDRIEITSDFTPSPSLMIATAALIVGVVREVMNWPSYELDALSRHGIPVISGFRPMPHTSRKGWLARFDCYPENPFICDVDTHLWPTQEHRVLSLRAIAGHTLRHFWRSIRRMCDPFTFRLLVAVIQGRSPSLLDLDDRPDEYEDVGRLCAWDAQFPPAQLGRSRYERVVMRAVSGQQLRVNGHHLRPVGMRGWSAVVFERDDAQREVIAIDDLIPHLGEWERP